MTQERSARQVLLATPKRKPSVDQGPPGVIASPTLLGSELVWSQQNIQMLPRTVRYLVPWGCCHSTFPSQRKRGCEIEWMRMHEIYRWLWAVSGSCRISAQTIGKLEFSRMIFVRTASYTFSNQCIQKFYTLSVKWVLEFSTEFSRYFFGEQRFSSKSTQDRIEIASR